jgi:hypothetical protein
MEKGFGVQDALLEIFEISSVNIHRLPPSHSQSHSGGDENRTQSRVCRVRKSLGRVVETKVAF